MCGIAGFTGARRARETTLRAMSAALEHRGPDQHSEYSTDEVSLAIRRLAIIDIDGGQQPYYNESRDIVAVFNGEIYGFAKLRAELKRCGHHFRTEADGEVIVHAYEEFGDGFLTRIDGMFAIAMWDSQARRLLLARDRLGKKPLYVARTADGSLIFASELLAVLADPSVDREVNDVAIAHFLRFGYVPSPLSAVRAVTKLQPGSALAWRSGRSEEFFYWRLDYEPKLSVGFEAGVDEFDHRVAAAVEARLISDVPLGAFLSGGADSSLVVAHMARASESPVKTFSIGFADPRYDERPYAAEVARLLGTDHQDEVIGAGDLTDVLPMLIRQYGEPYADSSAIPTYYLARLARREVTVVLTGDGGDELLGGYDRHVAARMASHFDRLPSFLRVALMRAGDVVAVAAAHEHDSRYRLHRFLRSLEMAPEERFADWSSAMTAGQRRILAPGTESLAVAIPEGKVRHPLDRALAADVAHYLPDDLLTKVDIATMACSLEARCPLLDYELVEWSARLPVRLKQRRLERKRLLHAALGRHLPRRLFERPKMGFAAPIGDWLRNELRELVTDTLLDRKTIDRGYVDPAETERALRQHLAGEANHTRVLWTLLTLELWHREIVDSLAPSAE